MPRDRWRGALGEFLVSGAVISFRDEIGTVRDVYRFEEYGGDEEMRVSAEIVAKSYDGRWLEILESRGGAEPGTIRVCVSYFSIRANSAFLLGSGGLQPVGPYGFGGVRVESRIDLPRALAAGLHQAVE